MSWLRMGHELIITLITVIKEIFQFTYTESVNLLWSKNSFSVKEIYIELNDK